MAFVFFISLFVSCNSFAGPSIYQYLNIPYGTVAGDYWTGIAIHNESDLDIEYHVTIYDANGTLIGESDDCLLIDAHATHVDLIENFIDESFTGRFSVIIRPIYASTYRFSVTMFMGNTGSSNQGFAFTTYRSENSTNPVLPGCTPEPIKLRSQ